MNQQSENKSVPSAGGNIETNSFVRLNAINVSAQLEMKGPFSYLSWPFAVAELRTADPAACWEVKRFDGLPYLATETGFYVEVAVTVAGVTLSQIHPVLDTRNRPILAPNAFDINTSIQRCLVKAIALHGLGLSVYAGEDLREVDHGESPMPISSSKPKAPARRPPTPLRPVGATINGDQEQRIHDLIRETGADLARLLAYFGVGQLAEIQASQYQRVVRSLEHRRAA